MLVTWPVYGLWNFKKYIKIIVDLDAFWETIKKVNEPDTYPLQYCGVRWSKNADW